MVKNGLLPETIIYLLIQIHTDTNKTTSLTEHIDEPTLTGVLKSKRPIHSLLFSSMYFLGNIFRINTCMWKKILVKRAIDPNPTPNWDVDGYPG